MTICKRCGVRLDVPDFLLATRTRPHTHVALDTVGSNHEPLGRWQTMICIACTKLLHAWLEPS